MRKAERPGAFLNERLMSDLRPTLFLAQLPNLLAGNISLVHGVVGSSRTFLGEEAAGVDAVRIAQARIAAGQSELTLVGGAYHGARWDVLLDLSNESGVLLKAAVRAGLGPRPEGRHRARRRWARSWCWKVASTRRRAAHVRGRGIRSGPSDRKPASDGRHRSDIAPAMGRQSPRRSTAKHAAVISGADGQNRRHRRNARS